MNAGTIQQEVLLVIDTGFFGSQLCKRKNLSNLQTSQAAELEELCWDGLLYNMLPELLEISPAGKRLNLWEIRSYKYCLGLECCALPLLMSKKYSIRPELVLSVMLLN